MTPFPWGLGFNMNFGRTQTDYSRSVSRIYKALSHFHIKGITVQSEHGQEKHKNFQRRAYIFGQHEHKNVEHYYSLEKCK